MVDLADPALGVTAQMVRERRAQTGLGMMECKRELTMEALAQGIRGADDLHALKLAMLRMLSLIR